MRTANPALTNATFSQAHRVTSGEVMTLSGTVNKTFVAIGITVLAAMWSWGNPQTTMTMPVLLGAALGGFVVAMVVTFKQSLAPYLTPVYALLEGVFLGAISLQADMRYPGVVPQAIAVTFGTLFALLAAYRSGMIRPSENFKLGLVAVTGGIALMYLVLMVLSMFGVRPEFFYGSSLLSIGITAVVAVVAALNLVLDFDFIENGAAAGNQPKYMEWYGAFGLLVTLVWLYIEVLRLLTKIQDRR